MAIERENGITWWLWLCMQRLGNNGCHHRLWKVSYGRMGTGINSASMFLTKIEWKKQNKAQTNLSSKYLNTRFRKTKNGWQTFDDLDFETLTPTLTLGWYVKEMIHSIWKASNGLWRINWSLRISSLKCLFWSILALKSLKSGQIYLPRKKLAIYELGAR